MRICGIENCGRKVVARGLCSSHYQMWYDGYAIPTFPLTGPHGNQQKEIETINPSGYELGWLVGLLEGEGHFSYAGTQQLVIGMTDLDTVLKFKRLCEKLLQLSKPIHLITTHTGRNQDSIMYSIRLYGAKARAIMRLIVRHMSARRRAAIWQALNKFAGTKLDLISIIAELKNANSTHA